MSDLIEHKEVAAGGQASASGLLTDSPALRAAARQRRCCKCEQARPEHAERTNMQRARRVGSLHMRSSSCALSLIASCCYRAAVPRASRNHCCRGSSRRRRTKQRRLADSWQQRCNRSPSCALGKCTQIARSQRLQERAPTHGG